MEEKTMYLLASKVEDKPRSGSSLEKNILTQAVLVKKIAVHIWWFFKVGYSTKKDVVKLGKNIFTQNSTDFGYNPSLLIEKGKIWLYITYNKF